MSFYPGFYCILLASPNVDDVSRVFLLAVCDLSPYDNPTINSVGVLVLTRSIFPSLVRAVSEWLVRYNQESTLRFPAKENPNMKKALFDWPMVLQYDVKTEHRLISREFSGMNFFHQNGRLTNQKPRRLYPFDKRIKSLYLCSLLFLFYSRVFILM